MPETRKMQRPVSPRATNDADDQPQGNCYGTDDPELWFSNDFRDQSLAALICSTCPLKNECATVALERGEWGVWGGTTEDDRAKLAKVQPGTGTFKHPRLIGIQCSRGHKYTGTNTGTNPDGTRKCLACAEDRKIRRRENERRAAAHRRARNKEMSA